MGKEQLKEGRLHFINKIKNRNEYAFSKSIIIAHYV